MEMLNVKNKKKLRNLKDGEETANNIRRRGMAKTLDFLSNLRLKKIIIAIAITESQKGICPYCKKGKIDHNLVENFCFPFCIECAKKLGSSKGDFLKNNLDREKYQEIEEKLKIAV